MKHKSKFVTFTVFIFIFACLLTLYLPVNAETTLSSIIKSEEFTLGSNTFLKKDDNTASNNTYIEFSIPITNFQPTSPFYSTFYYAWYKTQSIDGTWSYWSDFNSPPTTWFSHYLPDPNPSVFDPVTELYSVNDYNIFKWQMSKMAEAKIEVAISSWWGQNGKEDTAFNNIVSDFMKRTDNPYPNLRWAMYYECEGISNEVCGNTSNPTVSKITSDLNYIKSKYVNSPYFLKINGKPVMFVYGGTEDDVAATQTMTQRWKDANAATGNSFYLVLKLFSGYANDAFQPDSWHQYAPAVRSGSYGTYSSFVSPGFWLDDTQFTSVRLPRDLKAFDSAVSTMVNQNTTWKLVETWNEWGEGTSVEPGNQTTKDINGKEILDPNGTPFGNAYINILSKYFPPLEAGSGFNSTIGRAPITECNTEFVGKADTIFKSSVSEIFKVWVSGKKIEGADPKIYLNINNNCYSLISSNNFKSNSWGWYSTDSAFTLPAAESKIEIISVNGGFKIDDVFITNNLSCIPKGIEALCSTNFDFDGNGNINISDVILLLNKIFNDIADINPESNPDINNDGKINLVDVVLFLQAYLF